MSPLVLQEGVVHKREFLLAEPLEVGPQPDALLPALLRAVEGLLKDESHRERGAQLVDLPPVGRLPREVVHASQGIADPFNEVQHASLETVGPLNEVQHAPQEAVDLLSEAQHASQEIADLLSPAVLHLPLVVPVRLVVLLQLVVSLPLLVDLVLHDVPLPLLVDPVLHDVLLLQLVDLDLLPAVPPPHLAVPQLLDVLPPLRDVLLLLVLHLAPQPVAEGESRLVALDS